MYNKKMGLSESGFGFQLPKWTSSYGSAPPVERPNHGANPAAINVDWKDVQDAELRRHSFASPHLAGAAGMNMFNFKEEDYQENFNLEDPPSLPPRPKSIRATPREMRMAHVLYNRKAENEDELELLAGEGLRIHGSDPRNKGWVVAEHLDPSMSGPQKGLVPENYIHFDVGESGESQSTRPKSVKPALMSNAVALS